MKRSLVIGLFLIVLLGDLLYSFEQFKAQPLDGDIAANIMIREDTEALFNSPFGITALAHDSSYVNPNRFFSHWTFQQYMFHMPPALHSIKSPINSLYTSTALIKLIIQIALILILASAISGTNRLLSIEFLLSAVLITPLFQTNGYQGYMGIIDPSITYTFFYALPAVWLLFYFLPFFNHLYHDRKWEFSIWQQIVWFGLACMVCLSGALNPGIVLILSLLLFLHQLARSFQLSEQSTVLTKVSSSFKGIPTIYWKVMLPVAMLSLYALFLGRYNSNSLIDQMPLGKMYAQLPYGLYKQFTSKPGFPILIGALLLNAWIIRKHFYTGKGPATFATL